MSESFDTPTHSAFQARLACIAQARLFLCERPQDTTVPNGRDLIRIAAGIYNNYCTKEEKPDEPVVGTS